MTYKYNSQVNYPISNRVSTEQINELFSIKKYLTLSGQNITLIIPASCVNSIDLAL